MKKITFLVASQNLYGDETLKSVKNNALEIEKYFNQKLKVRVEFMEVVISKETATQAIENINNDKESIGVIIWAHTFSPAKMWGYGLRKLEKPLLHLHTQFYNEIPWDTINMDYMNLHQSAHGDRELSYIMTRENIVREVVVGHFKDEEVIQSIERWSRNCMLNHESKNMKILRFGDNMNKVAVTDGDRVYAEDNLNWTIDTIGIGDLVKQMSKVEENDIDKLLLESKKLYDIEGDIDESVRYQLKVKIAIEQLLIKGGYSAFTTTFEVLHGLEQLPGLACQLLMRDGYGFAGEGDWKTAALVALFKKQYDAVSFMEDYTYNFASNPQLSLQSHMLEICPSIANDSRAIIKTEKLGIGGKSDPARLTFKAKVGNGVVVSLIDMGNRFRLIANEVNSVTTPCELPNLPVAYAFFDPKPNLKDAATSWLYLGGAHHTVYIMDATCNDIERLAKLLGIEFFGIDENTKIADLWRIHNGK